MMSKCFRAGFFAGDRKSFILSVLVCFLAAGCFGLYDKAYAVPAFPGAEGFGSETRHARGKKVFHVTRLDDLDAAQQTGYFESREGGAKVGCFRWALAAAQEAGGGYIVFDVAGTIALIRSAIVPSNTYIAGQSAPGSGIAVTRQPIIVSDASDVIIRHIRCRGNHELGAEAKGEDAILITGSKRVVLDHVSVSFFQDGAVDIVSSSDITLQWSHFGDAVDSNTREAYHGEPHLVRSGSNRITMHHNYLTHVHSRAPWFTSTNVPGGLAEFSNCVVYNFRKYPSAFDIPDGRGHAVGNYYIPGRNTHGSGSSNSYRGAIIGSNNFTLHVRNNRFISSTKNAPGHDNKGCPGSDQDTCIGDDAHVTGSRPDDTYPEDSIMGKQGAIGQSPGELNYSSERFSDIPLINYTDVEKNLNDVIARFGAWPRDNTDLRLKNELLTRTGMWKLEKPDDHNIYSGEPVTDADRDGMADDWELSHGGNLDPNGRDLDPDYDNIEVYLQHLHTIHLADSPVYSHERADLSSAAWEREASVAAYRRHLVFRQKHVDMLERDQDLFPPPGRPLSSAIKDRFAEKEFLVFSASIHNKVYRYVAPEENDILKNAPLAMSAARDEWESLQIGIWALTDLSGVTWGVSDLVHENGLDRLNNSPSALRTYFVSNVFARKVENIEVTPDMDIDPSRITGKGVAYYREEPAALVDLPDVDVPAGTAQSLWLDLYVGPDTAAGRYHGTLFFKTNGEIKARHPLVVTVHPFTLDQAREWGRGAYISKFIDEKEAVNLIENGHNQVSWWTSSGYSIKLQGDQVTADFSSYTEYLKMLDRAGMKGPHAVFLGGDSPKLVNEILRLLGRKGISNGRDQTYRSQYVSSDLSPPFESYLIQVLEQYQQQMKTAGHGDILSVLLDEPDHKPGPERLNWYNTLYAMVEKQIPKLPTMGVFYHEGDEKKLSHHHAVWSTNRPSIELYNACKKANRKLFTYHGGFRFYNAPGKVRFSIGIIPWVYDAAGTFYWAIWNHSDAKRAKDDIFLPDQFGGQSTTIARAPLGSSYGPLSTLIHKGFREAVDDARYIKTLEKRIEGAMGTKIEKKAIQHKKWLQDIKSTLRKKMVVRGGHVQNHRERVGFHFAISSLEFKGMDGKTCNLESLEAFSDFMRADVTKRILDLLPRNTTMISAIDFDR